MCQNEGFNESHRDRNIGISVFAVTFILNRAMELSGGSWMWSSSLRFLLWFRFIFDRLCERKMGAALA